jgi:cysteine desulfurase
LEVYLDNSATTRQLDEVTDLMTRVMREDYGNPSSLHRRGMEAEKILKKARAATADAMGVSPGEVIFTSGGTESDNMLIEGACETRKRYGNKIITSAVEHPAVLETFARMEKAGFEAVYVGVDSEGFVDLEQMKSEIDENTILVSLMQVNNETGSIQPVEEVAAMKGQALMHSDCVQSFCKMPLPLNGVDMIAVSGHKIHGPKGIGAAFVRKGVHMVPLLNGGGQEGALRSGTENVPAVAGFGLAAQMMTESLEQDAARMAEVRDYLRRGIEDQIADVKINTPEKNVAPGILNVSFLGTRGEVILHTLEQDGIYVSTGSACSSHKKGGSHVLKAMGLRNEEIEGALRFSLNRFHTTEDMDFVLDKLKTAVQRFRKLGSFR